MSIPLYIITYDTYDIILYALVGEEVMRQFVCSLSNVYVNELVFLYFVGVD
jgi:hypothetical protein